MTFTSTSVATLGGLDTISTTVGDPNLLADANVTAQLSAAALGLAATVNSTLAVAAAAASEAAMATGISSTINRKKRSLIR